MGPTRTYVRQAVLTKAKPTSVMGGLTSEPDGSTLRLASAATTLSVVNKARDLLLRLLGQPKEKDEAAMIWKKDAGKTSDDGAIRDSLSFEGNGRVSVPVASIVKSERAQQQVKAVREIQASQEAAKE